MSAATEGRRKPFHERALTSSKDRTTKQGRKSGRKKPVRTLLIDTRNKPLIGDPDCPEAEYHSVELSGYYDPNGHPITKGRYDFVTGGKCSNPECPKAGDCGGRCVADF